MSFKEKTAKGFAWTLVDTMFNYAGLFIINIVLARLLSPIEFGIIGILAIFLTVFENLIDGGFTNALIRAEDVDKHDYNTVFLFNLTLSIALYLIFFAIAPLISFLFEDNDLTVYARVLGVILIINALSGVQRTILTRAIDFKYQAVISITSTILSGVIGIYMAYTGFGVWSLIAQQLTRSLITTAMFWIKSSWYPQIEFSISSFKKLFAFGWKIMVSSLIGTIGTEINSAVIGITYTKETLGLYTRAKQFTDVVSIKLTSVIRRVTFPAFSSIQQDEEHLIQTYRKMLRLITLISCSLLMFMAAIAEPMIQILLGEKWTECVPLLVLLCFMWLFYAPNVLNLNMLQVKGRSDLFLYDQILAVIIGFIPLIIAFHYGIIQMLYVSIVTQFIMYVVGILFCNKVIDYSFRMQFKDLLPVMGVSLGTFLVVDAIGLLNFGAWEQIIIQCLCGIGVFVGLCYLLCRQEFALIRQMFFKMMTPCK